MRGADVTPREVSRTLAGTRGWRGKPPRGRATCRSVDQLIQHEEGNPQRLAGRTRTATEPVSYTHLTLPTICSV
eukprot:4013794-Alexandrium_andersonii.AAC.1